MRYTAKGQHNKDFELFDVDGNSLGRLDYEGWFSMKVSILIGDDKYDIQSSSFWQTKLEVLKGDRVVADLKYNFGGNMVVNYHDVGTYLFKPSFWHSKFSLHTEHEKEIIMLKPDFQWRTFKFDYDIETDDNYLEGKNPLLVLILIYCCNHMKQRGAGASAAM
ncbi:MAG: hypothetical protein JST82_02585 [Bacteroidetes bacterium]|nr:hypothetical protein [Bacteroidota bacterium]